MNIQCIAEHSIDLDLLSGGICIDAGCRGFQFSEAMRDLGCEVFAHDLEEMQPPSGIKFINRAIGTETKKVFYKDTKDPQAKHIAESGIEVQMWAINDIYKCNIIEGKHFDIVKLDVEGEEYKILSDPNFQPIPKQISVEFHMHAHRALHDQYYDKCMENLLKWYEPVKHELTQAHGAGFNYWDSLFVRKDLINNHE